MQEQSGGTNSHSKSTRIYTKDGTGGKILLVNTDSRITLQLLQNKKKHKKTHRAN